MNKMIEDKIKALLLKFQQNEINEHYMYRHLSGMQKDTRNAGLLLRISADELKHYNVWKSYTGIDIKPEGRKIWKYIFLARIFGVTFAIKIMENGEKGAQQAYKKLIGALPETEKIIADENKHESGLILMVNEERLKYISSIVLGLNDALIELTGTLAGLAFAFENSRIVGVAGLIMGVAAALSMAGSEYLSTRSEGDEKNPLLASFYTGITYIVAVAVLIIPFLLINNHFLSLSIVLIETAIIIAAFNFYFSVVRDVSFIKRFAEMLAITFGVAAISFVVGMIVRQAFGGSI